MTFFDILSSPRVTKVYWQINYYDAPLAKKIKNATFSTTFHRVSEIIRNVRTTFEISDTRLLDALCDAKTEEKNDVRHKYSK